MIARAGGREKDGGELLFNEHRASVCADGESSGD